VAEILAVVEGELAGLRAENARLLRLLKMTPEQAAPLGHWQAAICLAFPRRRGWASGTADTSCLLRRFR
jgi:hypothetical protein